MDLISSIFDAWRTSQSTSYPCLKMDLGWGKSVFFLWCSCMLQSLLVSHHYRWWCRTGCACPGRYSFSFSYPRHPVVSSYLRTTLGFKTGDPLQLVNLYHFQYRVKARQIEIYMYLWYKLWTRKMNKRTETRQKYVYIWYIYIMVSNQWKHQLYPLKEIKISLHFFLCKVFAICL